MSVENVNRGSMPVPDSYTGKLPKELVKDMIASAEEFKKKWELANDEFDLQTPHLIHLSLNEPFLSSLSRRLTKVKAAWLPTAGVAPTKEGWMQFFYNPIFFYELVQGDDGKTKSRERGFRWVQGVIKHELFHIIYEHVTFRRAFPHALWNAATDCAINSLIDRNELPDFCLIPGELYTPVNPPKDWEPSLIARKIKEFPKAMSAEWYMHRFLEDDEIQKAMEEAREETGQSGSSSNDKDFEKALKNKLYGDSGGQFDDHDLWDDLSESDKDQIRDMMRNIFRDCVREAEQSANGWGNVPADIKAYLKKLISKEVDWRDLLSNFLGRSRAMNSTTSFKRMNRRTPWEAPGKKRKFTCKPACALDQSGSMTDYWIELMFAEMSSLGNYSGFDILPFDTAVNENEIQRIRRGQTPDIIRTRAGGTDFSVPISYVNDHPDDYDCLMILTDGMCDKPISCVKPVVYILPPNCNLYFETTDLVIKMSEPNS